MKKIGAPGHGLHPSQTAPLKSSITVSDLIDAVKAILPVFSQDVYGHFKQECPKAGDFVDSLRFSVSPRRPNLAGLHNMSTEGLKGVELKLDMPKSGPVETYFKGQTVKMKIADAVLSVQPISIENKSTSTNEASAKETVRLGDIVSTPQVIPQGGVVTQEGRTFFAVRGRRPNLVGLYNMSTEGLKGVELKLDIPKSDPGKTRFKGQAVKQKLRMPYCPYDRALSSRCVPALMKHPQRKRFA